VGREGEVSLLWKTATESKTYWRVHPNDRPFSPDHATSREWASEHDHDKGYSAVEKPEDLVAYFNPSDRETIRDSAHVVHFSGHEVGRGMDGEPLVMPDMRHVKKMDWDDLESHVGRSKVDDIDDRNDWTEMKRHIEEQR
jgi:hypothetical protein